MVIRGHNLLKLKKVDYTELPMAKEIVRASVLDYAHTRPIEKDPPKTQHPQPSDREPDPPRRRARLYGSSKPPEGF